MAPESTAKATRQGLSLYANLLGSNNATTSAPGTISRAPVVFKQSDGGAEGNDGDVSAHKQQPNAASLRFQPTKRPQSSTQKIKPKPALPKMEPQNVGGQGLKAAAAGDTIFTLQQPAKITISDWAAEPEDDGTHGFYPPEKRQRGGRKKRKKVKDSHVAQNWDDIYDPARPNSYNEYQNSDEKILEIQEWKDRLYAHRYARKRTSSVDSNSNSDSRVRYKNTKAHPGLSFAPPTELEHDYPAPRNMNYVAEEDAHARHLKLTGATELSTAATSQGNIEHAMPAAVTSRHFSIPDSLATLDHTVQSAVPDILRAPVRYNFPFPPPDIPGSEAELANALQEDDVGVDALDANDAPRSSRPGQKGFAERLMSKYGWTKGSGLGASGTGIVNPLRVQVEKQKKKPDSEGGGYVGSGGRGKIIGGKKAGASTSVEGGKFGVMSEVIVLGGMLNGLDLDAEIERAQDGGLLQEIGDECGDKYGRVERVYIDRNESTETQVFVKFTSQLSALRAVNALQGRIFNGNTITAMFYDAEKFDSGTYS
ncbi:MAG: hypothetical protein Q9211_001759 [Gyalolechia sp. 1 TL-2023]